MLLLFLVTLLCIGAVVEELEVDKDVGIMRDLPSANGGANEEIRVADGARALIKFDIDDWDEDDILFAELQLRVVEYSGNGLINAFPLRSKIDEGDGVNYPSVRLGSDGEDGSTWNCPHGDGDVNITNLIDECDDDETQIPGGDFDDATARAVDFQDSSRIKFDVTEDVRDGVENWVIKWDNERDCIGCNDFVTFYSKEGSTNRSPKMELEVRDASPKTPPSLPSAPEPQTADYQESTAYTMADVFDPSRVRRYDLTMDERDLDFLYSDPVLEEYVPCSLEVDWGRGGRIEWEGAGCRFKGSGSSLMGCLVGEQLPLNSPDTSSCRSLSWKVDSNEFIDAPQTFFGLKKLQFHGMSNGRSLITERLAYEAMNESGLPISRAVHAELYINGRKIGLYLLVEQIDSSFTKDRFSYDDRNGDGELYKEAYWNGLDSGYYNSFLKEGDGRFDQMWVDFTYEARDFMQTNPSESAARNFVKDHFHYDSFINYAPFPILFSNFDHFWFVLCGNNCRDELTGADGETYPSLTGDNRYRHNFYHYMEERNGRTLFYLVGWDYDISFTSMGQNVGGTVPNQSPGGGSSGGSPGGGSSGGRGTGGRGTGGRGTGGRDNKKIRNRSAQSLLTSGRINATFSNGVDVDVNDVKLLQQCSIPEWWDTNTGNCEFCTWKVNVVETANSCDPVGELMAIAFRRDYRTKMEEYVQRFDNDWFERRMLEIRDFIRPYVEVDPLTDDIRDWEDEIQEAITYYTKRGGARDLALESVQSIN